MCKRLKTITDKIAKITQTRDLHKMCQNMQKHAIELFVYLSSFCLGTSVRATLIILQPSSEIFANATSPKRSCRTQVYDVMRNVHVHVHFILHAFGTRVQIFSGGCLRRIRVVDRSSCDKMVGTLYEWSKPIIFNSIIVFIIVIIILIHCCRDGSRGT